ncbi:MAG: M48 family metallopeptidase [Burkholderiaceae bacterium]
MPDSHSLTSFEPSGSRHRCRGPALRRAAALSLTAAIWFALPAPALPQAATTAPGSTTAAPGTAAQREADDQHGVDVGRTSRALALASAEEVEREAIAQYEQLKREAASQRALAPADHPQLQRLRRIAAQIIPFAPRFNERARQWQWEVNLIGSKQINAFCLPGGKIAFFSGILDTLQLSDDEVAIVMGHEIAHALREHGRARVGKARLAQGLTLGASVLSQLFGFGDLGGHLASGAAQLTMLKYSRDDETEADIVGMDLAARAGFDPRAGIELWRKMSAASKGQPPQWLSTHPSHDTRIVEIQRHLDATLPLYAATRGTTVAQLPPYRSKPPVR